MASLRQSGSIPNGIDHYALITHRGIECPVFIYEALGMSPIDGVTVPYTAWRNGDHHSRRPSSHRYHFGRHVDTMNKQEFAQVVCGAAQIPALHQNGGFRIVETQNYGVVCLLSVDENLVNMTQAIELGHLDKGIAIYHRPAVAA